MSFIHIRRSCKSHLQYYFSFHTNTPAFSFFKDCCAIALKIFLNMLQMDVLSCVILFIIYLIKKLFFKPKSMPLPTPILYYITKNSSIRFQIKLSQTSKSMLTNVRKVRNYDFREVHISPLHNSFKMELNGWNFDLTSNIQEYKKLNKLISAKHLWVHELNVDDFMAVLKTISTQNYKRMVCFFYVSFHFKKAKK